ncbi:MAG: organoarsenical effux MFS transporter ArsJ [Planctomycetes bacterium]|nr:organoarsenical effux MFS transporter ArsJ [Planctomycetota bacterium]
MTGSLREYALVSACYQAFTLSDGALRMLVLLHLHARGQTPLGLALALLPYEAMGVVTNLLGGHLAARFGLRATLLAGLLLQITACLLLAFDPTGGAIAFVMVTQVLSGVAKDLAKTSAKSYVRRLEPRARTERLFALVALLTGGKNAMKGLGFFVGGALLAWIGFRATNLVLATLLATLGVLAAMTLPQATGKRGKGVTALFSHEPAVQWLALARLFLFGARDVWFAVALPVFCSTVLGWSPAATGAFLAVWVIGYGAMQAATPRYVVVRSLRAGALATMNWTWFASVALLGAMVALLENVEPALAIVVGLCIYGLLFAVVSSLHSWLIVGIAGAEDVAERVGFYYAANAAGRLCGTLGSGVLYGLEADGRTGLIGCLAVAAGATMLAAGLCAPVVRTVR